MTLCDIGSLVDRSIAISDIATDVSVMLVYCQGKQAMV